MKYKKISKFDLWQKIKQYARQAGLKVVYTVLLLYHAYKRKETPRWAKNIAIGALGYFIAPIDALPDLTPIIGYTDDLSLLTFSLVTISAYVNDEVRQNARKQLTKWFGKYDTNELDSIDKKL